MCFCFCAHVKISILLLLQVAVCFSLPRGSWESFKPGCSIRQLFTSFRTHVSNTRPRPCHVAFAPSFAAGTWWNFIPPLPVSHPLLSLVFYVYKGQPYSQWLPKLTDPCTLTAGTDLQNLREGTISLQGKVEPPTQGRYQSRAW